MVLRRVCPVLLCPVLMFLSAFTAYAQNGVYLRGDADGDGMLTIMDATRVQRVLAEIEPDDFTHFVLITTSSAIVGTAPPSQFEAVSQSPPVAPV